MIEKNTLDDAISEAQRFIKAARQLKAARNHPGTPWQHGEYKGIDPKSEGREHAACRRASMDLTRILADLRASR